MKKYPIYLLILLSIIWAVSTTAETGKKDEITYSIKVSAIDNRHEKRVDILILARYHDSPANYVDIYEYYKAPRYWIPNLESKVIIEFRCSEDTLNEHRSSHPTRNFHIIPRLITYSKITTTWDKGYEIKLDQGGWENQTYNKFWTFAISYDLIAFKKSKNKETFIYVKISDPKGISAEDLIKAGYLWGSFE